MNKKRKIAYISGTRADFGLMTPVLLAIGRSPRFSLRVYATGMHLMPEFGKTWKEVVNVFPNARQIPAVFKSHAQEGIAEFAGAFLPKIVSAFERDRPDFVLLLGDRAEQLMTATACLYLGIPTGHLHGGEKTHTVDELARHAITKLASLHFTSTKETARRLAALGEKHRRIFITGAPALDTIARSKLPSPNTLRTKLGLAPRERFILLTEHPVSEEWREAGQQMREILAAVKEFKMPVVIVYPNADTGGALIIKEINRERRNPLFRIFRSVPFAEFLALERDAAVWVGNSSALMLESASFKTPAVHVGTRELGREHGGNVLMVGYDRREIAWAIRKSLSDAAYLRRIGKVNNPWGSGKAAERIVHILETHTLNSRLLSKQLTY